MGRYRMQSVAAAKKGRIPDKFAALLIAGQACHRQPPYLTIQVTICPLAGLTVNERVRHAARETMRKNQRP